MKPPVAFVAFISLLAPAVPANAAELTLLREGKSDYQIVLPDEQPTAELAECLRQTARLVQTAFLASGAQVPVVAEATRDPAKPSLYLGHTEFAGDRGWMSRSSATGATCSRSLAGM